MTTPVVANPFQFRQVWRTISDGNRERHVLVLQVWEPAQENWHESYVKVGGCWTDVPITTVETDTNPNWQGK